VANLPAVEEWHEAWSCSSVVAPSERPRVEWAQENRACFTLRDWDTVVHFQRSEIVAPPSTVDAERSSELPMHVNSSHRRWFALFLVVFAGVELSPASTHAQCPNGATPVWRSRGTHEYFFCDHSVWWEVARAACHAYPASDGSPYYLVRPNDFPENAAIYGWRSQDIWIGVSDRDNERGSNDDLWQFNLGLGYSGAGIAPGVPGNHLWDSGQPDNDTSSPLKYRGRGSTRWIAPNSVGACRWDGEGRSNDRCS
jgi:hypothetical protein